MIDTDHDASPSPATAGPSRAPAASGAARWGRLALHVVMLSALALLSVPVVGTPFEHGLDPSWMVGLLELRGTDVDWGRDVAITYGPLGFINVTMDAGDGGPPLGRWLPLLGITLTWWASIAALAARIERTGPLLTFYGLAILLGTFLATDVENLPLLAVAGLLVAARLTGRAALAVPAAALAGVALLVKFNVGVASLGCLGAYLFARMLGGPRRGAAVEAAALLGVFAATLLGLFRAFGGPIAALPEFLLASLELASSYSSQMVASHPREPLLLVISALLGAALLAMLARDWRRPARRDAILIVLPGLFIAFKGAVVRSDTGHLVSGAITAFGLLLPLLAAAPGSATIRRLLGGLAVACLTMQLFRGPVAFPLDGPDHLARLVRWSGHREALAGAHRDYLEQGALPSSFLGRIGDAPVDVYPWDITLAHANGLAWSPRYTLQSYMALTPELDAASARSYREPEAAPFVLYRYQGIDMTHPWAADAQTALELYRWYRPLEAADDGQTLLLGRRESPRFGEPVELSSGEAAFGQRLEVPEAGGDPVVLYAELRTSPAGALREKLYKLWPPMIRVEYRDGEVALHRAVWRNLAGGVLVGDLPRDVEASARLLDGGAGDPVAAVTILHGGRWFEPRFPFRFARLPRADAAGGDRPDGAGSPPRLDRPADSWQDGDASGGEAPGTDSPDAASPRLADHAPRRPPAGADHPRDAAHHPGDAPRRNAVR